MVALENGNDFKFLDGGVPFRVLPAILNNQTTINTAKAETNKNNNLAIGFQASSFRMSRNYPRDNSS